MVIVVVMPNLVCDTLVSCHDFVLAKSSKMQEGILCNKPVKSVIT